MGETGEVLNRSENALLSMLRDVVHAEPALAVGRVEELAALRQIAAIGGLVFVGGLEDATLLARWSA